MFAERSRVLDLLDRASAFFRFALRIPVHAGLRACEPYRATRTKHELAICAIFRDEAPFLDEWISFHVGVGVTHFYLYNNFSTDDFGEALAPWVERSYVTVIQWPMPVGQISAYRHCVRQVRSQCRWLAFIDIDEFLFSPSTRDIRKILAIYDDLPAVEVWQLFFGSGGHRTRPRRPVTESYLVRGPLTRSSVKSIVNPRMIYKVGIHQCKYWVGHGLDTSRRRVTPERTTPVLDMLRINHYWSRSLQDLETKIARGDASTPQLRDRRWHFDFEQTLNAEQDESILPIVRAIHDNPTITAQPDRPRRAAPSSSKQ